MGERTVHRTCPLCEATCGLTITLRDEVPVEARGDDEDVFSQGFVCPKGIALIDLERDPDRIRKPLIKEDGRHREASWDEAFERIERDLSRITGAHGRDAVALYIGNPSAHGLAMATLGRVLIKAFGTRNIFSASTVDQMPKHLSAGAMFGTPLSVPVPDVDRTDHLLILGANPFASNGSLLTLPDLPGRLRALRKRGGKLVVVDPRRTRTAREADEHHFIVPGTDAHLLMAMVNTLFAEGLADPGALAQHVNGFEEMRVISEPFTPEVAAAITGIQAEDIRRMARELASARTAAVYARIGTTVQEFGTLASWLVDVLNVLTGNLDRPGGAMFSKPAGGSQNTRGKPGTGRGFRTGRFNSRVRGLPEVYGELPSAALKEEITTPGEGQVRALFTVAGNPVVSTPDASGLDDALAGLDLMVSVDIYLNETTRHADVILPAEPVLSRGHFDLALYNFAGRNVANYSAPALPLPDGAMHEWEIYLRLAAIATGQGSSADVGAVDDFVAREALRFALTDQFSPAAGCDEETAWKALGNRRGPERILDILLRVGPYGDGFGQVPGGLSLAKLEANPHGIDLGPLEPRIPEVLRTPSGKVELAPEGLVADVERLRATLARKRNGGMLLVGRRHLRSNNSWLHNIPMLAGGTNTCTLQVSPEDADRLGLADGGRASVKSSAGALEVDVEVTDEVMPGVVSIPHGWGHGVAGTRASVAAANAGVNSNVLARSDLIDVPSGNAVLNGIPVEVAPA